MQYHWQRKQHQQAQLQKQLKQHHKYKHPGYNQQQKYRRDAAFLLETLPAAQQYRIVPNGWSLEVLLKNAR